MTRFCLMTIFTALIAISLGCDAKPDGPKTSDDKQVNETETQKPDESENTQDDKTEDEKTDASSPDDAELSLAEALKRVGDGSAVLIDVRSDDEWNEAHFAQAQHISIDKISEDAVAACEGLDKDKLVLLH